MIYDIAIIGAGASGLMLGSQLKNQNICLIDGNSGVGQKIKVSGGGKCNITNKYLSSQNYIGDENFIDAVFENFDNKTLLDFLNKNKIYPKINEKIIKGTYFCNSSDEILQVFKNLTKHCHYFLEHKVLDVDFEEIFKIKTNKKIIKAKKLVVASGGPSFVSLGASNIAYEIAKKFGHKIVSAKPALVGFTVQKEQFWFKTLSGISLEVSLTVGNKNFQGKMLFAHKGCTGPAILNASLYWEKGSVELDFLPQKNLEDFLNSNAFISTALPLPKQFVKEFLNSIDLEDKPISKLSKQEFEQLKLLKSYSFSPAGNFGYAKAEVTKGGICTNEIDSQTMQSKAFKNLYFLGECLDITGELGGYNLQFAISSAYVCSIALNANKG